MTEAEALALPRRELDALVAEKVMGWRRNSVGRWLDPNEDLYHMDAPPFYSTDIAASWEVVDLLLEYWWLACNIQYTYQGIVVTLCPHPCHPNSETEDGWREPKDVRVMLDPRMVGDDDGPTPQQLALALTLAALKAVGEIDD